MQVPSVLLPMVSSILRWNTEPLLKLVNKPNYKQLLMLNKPRKIRRSAKRKEKLLESRNKRMMNLKPGKLKLRTRSFTREPPTKFWIFLCPMCSETTEPILNSSLSVVSFNN